jgi:pimeloyl-ACP methyl ester carboxylesterase
VKNLILGTLISLLSLAMGSAPMRADAGHWAQINGHPLYYEITGTGHPLLLLHGGGASVSASFSQQLDAFAANHQIIAPEQVGQGHSPDVSGPLSYTAMMEDTATLLEQLHLTDVDVVGWSDGGIIALMLAVNHPNLVHRVVISGANIAPNGLLDSDLAEMRNAVPSTGTPEKLRKLWVSAPTIGELNIDLLSHLNKPVLVMAGDHDVIKLAHTLKIYHALPRAQLSVLKNTGHATFKQRPELVNPMVLGFLAQN